MPMRLYRKGKIKDFGSGWFQTIAEAMQYEKNKKENNIISILWVRKDDFKRYFEPNGIGFRAKSESDYALANPVVESLTIEEFDRRIEHPILERIYGDGEFQ